MIHSQNRKIVSLFTPQSVATNGTASGTVSCVGFDYATVYLKLGTAAASNVDLTVAVSEGDTTSSFATATETNITTATPNTSTGRIYAWYLDLKKRKKFLKLQYNPNTSAAVIADGWIEFERAEQFPTSATLRGVDSQVVA